MSLAVSSMENAYKGPTKQPEAIHIEELAANIVVRTKIISGLSFLCSMKTYQITFAIFIRDARRSQENNSNDIPCPTKKKKTESKENRGAKIEVGAEPRSFIISFSFFFFFSFHCRRI